MTDAVASRWKDAFLETLRPYRGWPLFLSGGMDSAALLAGFLELGARPDCIAWQLTGSPTSDVRAATRMTAAHGLWLTVAYTPREAAAQEEIVRRVIATTGMTGKVAVQCAVAMDAMADAVLGLGEETAVIGVGGIVDDTRAVTIAARTATDAELLAIRRKDLEPSAGTEAMFRVAAAKGVELRDPYAEEPVASVGLSIPFAEMNRPKQKGIALRAFPWLEAHWRQNSPLQVASGLRELHDVLFLSNPRLNPKGSLAVAAVYRQMADETQGIWWQEEEVP